MPRRSTPDATPAEEGVRIDKWLWAARFYKTRSIASSAIEAGHVRIGGQRCKPSRTVHIDDTICLQRDNEQQEVIVRALSTLRGPASVAQRLYAETAESLQRRAEADALRRLAPPSGSATGRPSKRERRDLERWKGRTE
jgi:ribosome-associated heat shock protein Hsp15